VRSTAARGLCTAGSIPARRNRLIVTEVAGKGQARCRRTGAAVRPGLPARGRRLRDAARRGLLLSALRNDHEE